MYIQKPFALEPLPLPIIQTGNEKTHRLAQFLGRFEDQGMVWQTNGNANIWAKGDFGASSEVNFVSLIGTNATAATRCRLRLGDTMAEVDGAAIYDSGFQLIRTPALIHHTGKYHWYWELPALQNKRFWRIDCDSHAGDFEAMTLVMGKRLEFTNFYDQTGFTFGQDDLGKLELGSRGVNSKEDGVKMRTLSMDFSRMTDEDRIDKFQPLRDRLGNTGIAYWCFNGDPTTQRQNNQYLGWLRAPIAFQPSNFKHDRFQSQFEIRSII